MKKIIGLILIIITLTGCTKDTIDTTIKKNNILGVKFVTRGNINDNSYNYSIDGGLNNAKKKFRVDYTVTNNNGNNAVYGHSIITACEDDAVDIIVTESNEMLATVNEIAASYPNKKFIVLNVDNNYNEKRDNVITISFRYNQSGFLAGVVAGIVSKTQIIGFLAQQEDSLTKNILIGYISGAKYINPKIKIDIDFMDNKVASKTGLEYDENQMANNVDVTYMTTNNKQFIDTFSKNNKLLIGSVNNYFTLYNNGSEAVANKFVTSTINKLDIIIYDIIEKITNNSAEYGTHMSYGIKDGMITLVQDNIYKEKLSEEQQKEVTDIISKIYDSKIKIETYFDMTEKQYKYRKNIISAKNLAPEKQIDAKEKP